MYGVKKASPLGEENCKQFVALATDEGDKFPLTIGILLAEWLCAFDVWRFRIRHHNESHPAYQSGAKPHHVKNSHLPPKPKLPHKTPAIKKAKQIFTV